MIVDKELIVANRKKRDIVAQLRKLEFRPFPKISKAKAAGENEEVLDPDADEPEEVGTDADYDYLLGMAIWSLTEEKVSWTRGNKELRTDSSVDRETETTS